MLRLLYFTQICPYLYYFLRPYCRRPQIILVHGSTDPPTHRPLCSLPSTQHRVALPAINAPRSLLPAINVAAPLTFHRRDRRWWRIGEGGGGGGPGSPASCPRPQPPAMPPPPEPRPGARAPDSSVVLPLPPSLRLDLRSASSLPPSLRSAPSPPLPLPLLHLPSRLQPRVLASLTSLHRDMVVASPLTSSSPTPPSATDGDRGEVGVRCGAARCAAPRPRSRNAGRPSPTATTYLHPHTCGRLHLFGFPSAPRAPQQSSHRIRVSQISGMRLEGLLLSPSVILQSDWQNVHLGLFSISNAAEAGKFVGFYCVFSVKLENTFGLICWLVFIRISYMLKMSLAYYVVCLSLDCLFCNFLHEELCIESDLLLPCSLQKSHFWSSN
jgi:hypothetical protein